MKQQTLNLFKGKWGGRRPGSGRKRIHSKGVAHRKRDRVHLKHPLHINFKVEASIRNKTCLRLLKRAIFTHYSSLQFVKDLGALAKLVKMTIVFGPRDAEFLDPARSWILKKAETLSSA